MVVMSIDASSKSTGVAVFDKTGKLIYYTCIEDHGSDSLKRIKNMVNEIDKIYNEYKPTDIILEDILPEDVRNNQTTFNTLHYLQAAIVLKMHDYKQKVNICTASHWRSLCGMSGGRYAKRDLLKQQAMLIIQQIYGITANDDICDSICIGLAYLKENGIDILSKHNITFKEAVPATDEYGFEFK